MDDLIPRCEAPRFERTSRAAKLLRCAADDPDAHADELLLLLELADQLDELVEEFRIHAATRGVDRESATPQPQRPLAPVLPLRRVAR